MARGRHDARVSTRKPPVSKAPVRRRKAYHHGNLRASLVAAGVHVLEREGLAGLTIRAVARAVGVSHAAPINHFPELRGLLTAIATAGCEALNQRQLAGLESAGKNPFLRLQATGLAYLGFAREHREWFRLMWRSDLLDAGNQDLMDARGANWLLVSEAMQDFLGFRNRASARLQPRLLLALAAVHGLAILEIEGGLTAMKLEPSGQGSDHAAVVLELLAEAFASAKG